MSNVPIKRNDEEPSTRPGGQKSPALAAGLAALLLAGPAVGSVTEATAGSHPSFHDQFASSFTREVLPDDVCGSCTVKLPE